MNRGERWRGGRRRDWPAWAAAVVVWLSVQGVMWGGLERNAYQGQHWARSALSLIAPDPAGAGAGLTSAFAVRQERNKSGEGIAALQRKKGEREAKDKQKRRRNRRTPKGGERPPGAFAFATSTGRPSNAFVRQRGSGRRSVPSGASANPVELGRRESPGCCSGSPACSCSGTPTARSAGRCSSSRPGSPGSRPAF